MQSDEQPPVSPWETQSPPPQFDLVTAAQARPEPMAPFTYPVWVKLAGFTVLALTVWSLTYIPEYVAAVRQLRLGQKQLGEQQFVLARGTFAHLLKSHPTSSPARIGYAEAVFQDGDRANDYDGLRVLAGMKFDEYEMQELSRTLPPGFENAFTRGGY